MNRRWWAQYRLPRARRQGYGLALALIGGVGLLALVQVVLADRTAALTAERLAVTRNVERVRYYDEALRMSARVAVLQGGVGYERRYGRLEQEASATMAATLLLLRDGPAARMAQRAAAAGQALNALERQAFSGTRYEGIRGGRAVLDSVEYRNLRTISARGTRAALARFQTVSAARAQSVRRLETVSVVVTAGAGILGLLAWLFTRWDPRRALLVRRLRRAMREGQLEVHYQPKVELGTGRVVGAEALLRWRHPRRGMVPPGSFLPQVERSSFIGPLTEWVLEAAMHEARRWETEGHAVGVAVNLSTRTLVEDSLPVAMSRLLHSSGLPPQRLVLEITEGAYMSERDCALRTLTRLSDLGVRLSIDDFGTGHSSLARLKDLPVHELKIDRAFIAALGQDGDGPFVPAMITLGHGLGLRLVAEGVEDEERLERLTALGCDEVQGYLLSRPVPGPELVAWMDARAAAEAERAEREAAEAAPAWQAALGAPVEPPAAERIAAPVPARAVGARRAS